jgi:hypothetical protein
MHDHSCFVVIFYETYTRHVNLSVRIAFLLEFSVMIHIVDSEMDSDVSTHKRRISLSS